MPETTLTDDVDPRPARGLRPRLGRQEGLRAFGMDVCYERGEGSRLYGRPSPSEAGSEGREVWDFLGGYGATFFGHNHPAITAAARDFFDAAGVVHGQASVRRESEELGEILARRIHESVGGSYEIVFLNTGAEAVEAAAKHTDEVLAARRDRAREWTEASELGDGPLAWSEEATAQLRSHHIDPNGAERSALRAHNRRVLERPFVHLAAERSYHGMSGTALALTHDPEGRFGRTRRAGGVRFLDPEDPLSLARTLEEETAVLLRARRGRAGMVLETMPWTPVASVIVEPLQGEGGIHPLSKEVAAAWRAACDLRGVPLVVDEIQCGLGRTGTFLYSEQLGLRPDYVLLGKSLGGGVAKLSAVAIAAELFLPAFTLQHGSTFAGDGLSAQVARRALALLDEEHALEAARRKGEALREALRLLAARHPTVIKDVRGCGLMIGLEWQVMAFDRSRALHDLGEYGWLGYAIAGYLLRAHGIRVAPTLGHGHTLRLEPAYGVPPEATTALLGALEEVSRLLEGEDAAGLLAPGMELGTPRPRREAPAVRRRMVTPPPSQAHVGFVGHLIDPADLALWDESFSRLDRRGCAAFLDRIDAVVEPVVTHRDLLSSPAGGRTWLSFIGLAVPAARFYRALRTADRLDLRDLVQRAVDRAEEEGCTVVGLGGYCSIVTRNGRDLRPRGLALTTGNGYTVAAGLEAMRATAEETGIPWGDARAAVVGATGNIGSVMAELLAAEVGSLVLVGRETRREDLERLAGRLRRMGLACPIEVGSDPGLCRDAHLIVAASNQAEPVLFAEHLSRGPVVINDVSVPSDLDPSALRDRPRARVIRGGVVRVPCNPGWRVPGIPLPEGEMYACMAETVLMGLEGHRDHGSYGRLTPARVRATQEMAARHGFSSVRTLAESRY